MHARRRSAGKHDHTTLECSHAGLFVSEAILIGHDPPTLTFSEQATFFLLYKSRPSYSHLTGGREHAQRLHHSSAQLQRLMG